MAQESDNRIPIPEEPRLPGWVPMAAVATVVVVIVGAYIRQQMPPALPVPAPVAKDQIERAQPAPQPEPAFVPPTSALIRIYLRPFDDSEASLRQLRELAPLLPRQRVSIEQPIAPRVMMNDRFVTLARRLPRTSDLLANTATNESGADVGYASPVGQNVYFPALPLRRASDGVPRLGSSRFRVSEPGSIPFSGIIAQPLDDEPAGSEGHLLDYEVQAQSLARPEVLALLARPDVDVAFAPASVKFAESGCTTTETPFLDVGDPAELKKRAERATRTVDLIVVDSGWPDAAAQKASLERLYAMTNKVRARYGVPALTPVVPAFTRSGYDHAERVHLALEPLRRIDGTRVRVTYVPLSLAQESQAILHELIMMSSLIAIRGAYSGSAPDKQIEKAREDADEQVKRLPPKPGLVMPSDKFILDAVNRVASKVAEAESTYYVANYSFTFEAEVVGYDSPQNPRGLGVAAAGNDDLDLNAKKIDLARRAALDAHFVAVMNVDQNGGRDCQSSYIGDSLFPKAGVVGFTGSLGTTSQTSFSAPRVAWLIALSEASNRFVPNEDEWFGLVRDRLLGARSASQPYASIRLSALTLASLLD